MALSPYAERLISEHLSKAMRRGRLSPESAKVDELKKAQEKIYAYLQEIEKEKDGSETPRRMPERRISR